MGLTQLRNGQWFNPLEVASIVAKDVGGSHTPGVVVQLRGGSGISYRMLTVKEAEEYRDELAALVNREAMTAVLNMVSSASSGINWQEVDRINATRPPCYDFTPRRGA